jgi:hypothetical protein
LFGLTQIPSDNQIRHLLDPVPPSAVLPVFSAVVDALHAGGQLEAYRSISGDLLVAMDGTPYFSSAKIHCPRCTVTKHKFFDILICKKLIRNKMQKQQTT